MARAIPAAKGGCATFSPRSTRSSFHPGLFAEDSALTRCSRGLIGRLVAIDAFTQAFTNPLLAPRVFNPATF